MDWLRRLLERCEQRVEVCSVVRSSNSDTVHSVCGFAWYTVRQYISRYCRGIQTVHCRIDSSKTQTLFMAHEVNNVVVCVLYVKLWPPNGPSAPACLHNRLPPWSGLSHHFSSKKYEREIHTHAVKEVGLAEWWICPASLDSRFHYCFTSLAIVASENR